MLCLFNNNNSIIRFEISRVMNTLISYFGLEIFLQLTFLTNHEKRNETTIENIKTIIVRKCFSSTRLFVRYFSVKALFFFAKLSYLLTYHSVMLNIFKTLLCYWLNYCPLFLWPRVFQIHFRVSFHTYTKLRFRWASCTHELHGISLCYWLRQPDMDFRL